MQAHSQKKKEIMRKIDNWSGIKVTDFDKMTAFNFINYLEMIHGIVSEDQQSSFSFCIITEANGRGVEAAFHKKTGKYDIYLPGLAERFKEASVLFPIEERLKTWDQRLFFVAVHKYRHYLQAEKKISLITREAVICNPLLKKIVRRVERDEKHEKCSCSRDGINDKEFVYREFDSIVVQNYSLNRLYESDLLKRYGRFKDIPIILLKRRIAPTITVEA